jgi:hypothetical protein
MQETFVRKADNRVLAPGVDYSCREAMKTFEEEMRLGYGAPGDRKI